MALRHITTPPRRLHGTRRIALLGLRSLLACSLLASNLAASTEVAPNGSTGDPRGALLDRARSAEAIVEVTVLSTSSEWLASDDPRAGATSLLATRARARVEQHLAGFGLDRGDEIELLVPGGVYNDGKNHIAAYVAAAPVLRGGDELLVLLERWRGAWTPVDLRAGTLRLERAGLSGGTAYLDPMPRLNRPRNALGTRTVTAFDLSELEEALRLAASGLPTPTVDGQLQGISAGFSLTLSPDALPPFGCGDGGGNPIRWFEFERGVPVQVFAQTGGQAGVPGGGFDAVVNAVQAWTADVQSNVLLTYGGETNATLAIAGLDGISSIAFEDPGNQLPGSYPERTLLALTVAFFDCDRLLAFAGGLAHPLVELGVVTQNGVGSFFFGNEPDPTTALGEVLAHELGHGLGFAHPCDTTPQNPCVGPEDDALMRAVLHQNGRGATLGSDDRAALAFLYPGFSGLPPVAPSGLSASPINTDAVQLQWQDNSNDELGFDIEARKVGEPYTPFAATAANTTSLTLTGLDGSPRLFRVRARSGGGFSQPSNEAAATPMLSASGCTEDPTTLCLNGDRFLVRSTFSTRDSTGLGRGAELTEDTGTFWFFQPSNIELVVKVIDACTVFDHFWVFGGALTDVETALVVGDAQSGQTRTYFNPPNTPFIPIQDTAAFATCP